MMPADVVRRPASSFPAGDQADRPLAPFAELLRARFGLTFPPARANVLGHAVADAMRERGLESLGEYLHVVSSQRAALDRLASLATTGETYFFRYPQQLAVLRDFVLPAVLEARVADDDHVVRAWSAGCATGEEAYSLAALLDVAMPSHARWQPAVVGTDLSAEAITRASSGSYGRWSFRDAGGRPESGITVHDDGSATVDARLRSLVQFSVHNLAAPDADTPLALGGSADVVLCRNVLMYLEDAAAQRAIDLIYRSLRPGGWLLTGPSDVASDAFCRFERRLVDGVTLYRRPAGEAVTATQPAREAGGGVSAHDRRSAHRQSGARSSGHSPTAAGSAASREPGITPDIMRARRLADVGEHEEARRICTVILRSDSRNADAARLLVDISEAEADLPAARSALRVLMTHVPDDAMLWFRLALLERRLGNYAASERALAKAIAGTAHLSDDEQLDESGEMSALRLRSIGAVMSGGDLDG